MTGSVASRKRTVHGVDVRDLAKGSLGFSSSKALHITLLGASCTEHSPDPASRATTISVTSPGVTLVGQTVLSGHVATHGASGQPVEP